MACRGLSRDGSRLVRHFHSFNVPYRCFSHARHHAQSQSQPKDSSSSTTHFGYDSIPESEKASRVGSVFTSVAPSYDNMNDLMSLGIHRLWKDYFVRSIDPGISSLLQSASSSQPPSPSKTSEAENSAGQTILDVAGGTGDIALRLLDHATLLKNDTSSHVIVSDINPAMLAAGRTRLSSTPYHQDGRLSFLEADAEKFPTIEDSSIDLYTIAFGIRNFTSIPVALATAYRVLKPGGVFACLEFGKVGNPLLNGVYKRWSFGAIPLIGQLVAGDRDSYQYLVESIERFPDQRAFQGLIEQAGFLVPRYGSVTEVEEGGGRGWVDLTGGVASVHKGVKPAGREGGR